MAQVKNISNGPRGAYHGKQLIMAEVGEVIEATDFAEEWFEEVGDDPLDHDHDGEKGGSLQDDPPSLAGKTKAELLAMAAEEEVEADDGMTVAEIKAAIEAAREA